MNIRRPKSSDLSDLKLILKDTDLFPPEMLDEMIEPFFDGNDCHERWLVCEVDQIGVIGFSYTRAEEFAEGTWNLLAIGVRKEHQGKGYGTRLVTEIEKSLDQGRILIVETSSTDTFESTRRFYEARGYDKEAVIRDYWAKGDDKITFWKSLEA